MEEIEFRAWDKKRKEMLEIVTLKELVTGGSLCTLSDYVDKASMQYTRLKDKNGKKIYVGDILKTYKPMAKEPYYIKIVAVKGGFGFIGKYWWNDDLESVAYEGLSDLQNANWVSGTCEIIGNEFENPELLEI